MAIDDWDAFLRRVTGRINSAALASGYFDAVAGHEPKSAPSTGMSFASFMEGITPVPARSGLDATSAKLVMIGRIYKPFLSVPEDLIDPNIAGAAGYLMQAYSTDFELGGEVANIDLLGAHGVGLSARASYQTLDRLTFRLMDITIPMIINDAFDQEG